MSLPEHPKPFACDTADQIPGFPPARCRYVPATVFGVQTKAFDYNSPLPTANPDLTVWALMHAINGCSSKVIKLLNEGQVRTSLTHCPCLSFSLTCTP